jgi:hypothetical protein
MAGGSNSVIFVNRGCRRKGRLSTPTRTEDSRRAPRLRARSVLTGQLAARRHVSAACTLLPPVSQPVFHDYDHPSYSLSFVIPAGERQIHMPSEHLITASGCRHLTRSNGAKPESEKLMGRKKGAGREMSPVHARRTRDNSAAAHADRSPGGLAISEPNFPAGNSPFRRAANDAAGQSAGDSVVGIHLSTICRLMPIFVPTRGA